MAEGTLSLRKSLLLPVLLISTGASAPARHYAIDSAASDVSAKVTFFGIASKTARFPRMRGGAAIKADDPASTVLEVTLDARALTAPDSVTLSRLKSENFFWVERYPEVHFAARGVAMQTPTSGTMQGNLTARGVTRPVSLKIDFARPPTNARTVHPLEIVATTRIDRRDFNMTAYPLIVGKTVDIRIEAQLIPDQS